MSDFTKITLIIAIVLGIIALTVFAYLSAEKLEDQKVSKVESNIEQHLNNDVEELYDNEEDSEEDLMDGIAEDDDFEEYIEPEEEDWIEEDTIIAQPAPVAVTPKKQSPILLIAGSYKSQSNAGSKVKRMEKLGLKAEIVQLEGSNLFSVSIGSFDTEAAAEQSSEQIKSDLKVKSFVYKKGE